MQDNINEFIKSLDNPFWQFSLKIYSKKEIKEILLYFQDKYQFNVNLVLFVLWLGFSEKELSIDFLEESMNLIKPLQMKVTKNLRNIRKNAKEDLIQNNFDLFYKILLNTELASEAIEQNILCNFAVEQYKITDSFNYNIAAKNLKLLININKIKLDEEVQLHVDYLIKHV